MTTSAPAVNVVVPMGGLGTRFAKQGYITRPKPFVRVLGKEMLLWLLEKLNLGPDDHLVICFNPSYMATGRLMQRFVQERFPHVTLVELKGETRGAAETVLIALQDLPEDLRSRPTMLCDSDTFYTADIVSQFRSVAASSNACFVFHDTQPKPIYSYVAVSDDGKDTISAVKEKVKISDWANSGCYCFSSGTELEQECIKLLERGDQQLSQDKVPEYYTSGVISQMLGEGKPFTALKLNRSDFHVLGTPQQVVDFCASWPDVPRIRVAFALERSLAREAANGKLEPQSSTIQVCKAFKKQGHDIVIYTCSVDHTTTTAWLQAHGIPHDHLVLGTPQAHLYIDDNSLDTARGDIHQVSGFYENTGNANGPLAPLSQDHAPPNGAAADAGPDSTARMTGYLACMATGLIVGILVGSRLPSHGR